MSDDDCIHGMNPAWCSRCSGRNGEAAPPPRAGEDGFHGTRSKQNLANDLCDLLGVARYAYGPGSSLPVRVMEAAATRAKVRRGPVPKVGAAIAAKAGLPWGPECDSGRTTSVGTPTLTREGLEVMVRALGIIAKG